MEPERSGEEERGPNQNAAGEFKALGRETETCEIGSLPLIYGLVYLPR